MTTDTSQPPSAPRTVKQVRDEGSVSLFAVVAVVALMLAVGLVVDGGHKLQALQRADAAAEGAARAAGQIVQPARSVRGLAPQLDTARAASAARSYLEAAGVTGTVEVDPDAVQVTARTSEPTVFLAAIGINAVTATGSARARLVRGLEQEVP